MRYGGYIMMSRTQITLDREMQRRAQQRAAQLGISLAEYIRRLLAKDLGEPKQRHDPSLVFNLGSSGESDVADEKDRMIGQAVAAEHQRSNG